ncbi:8eb76dfc-b9fb-478d-85e2-3ad2ef51865f [Sclerotinia trifoliorum]|uniref:8eb76dfc-b9fb-478d-85e2-3ad2ef51865f n=1 Tax=Sclerotinia trifoliorum TaxID=28548 RepID=A0A8H2VYH7_9HELO|nr:8eb76dfc-b9fb-478d-85e2-3ad2ef51865f [Sclerotinia trifoliorum]
MASLLQSRAPSCLACLRRTTNSFGDGLLFSSSQQVRGKKKLAKEKDHNVTIQLLKPVVGIGRKGKIVQVPPGLMRNKLYGRGFAVYVTPGESGENGLRKLVSPPDSTFGKRKIRIEQVQDQEKPEKFPSGERRLNLKKVVELELLSPQRSTAILSDLIPPYIEFFETAITITPPSKVSPSLASSSSVSVAAAQNSTGKPEKVPIYGSVSTTDVATKMKTILVQDSEGKRVVFGPEDIKFVEETEEKDRVKHLGIYEVDIQLKGATDVVRRSIKINAQD